MPRGIYLRKPRRKVRRINRKAAAQRAEIKLLNAVLREERAAAGALLNIARMRNQDAKHVYSPNQILGALASGLGYTRR